MPTKPRIPKEVILKAAFEILNEKGYFNVNIKTIAKKIGCSTQPISWHFSNMNEFRKELARYCLDFANNFMKPNGNENPFKAVGEGYLNLAFDYPNLFKFIYMNDSGDISIGGVNDISNDEGNEELVSYFVNAYKMSKNDAEKYLMNVIIYTHGLMTMTVSKLINISKEEAREKMNDMCLLLLKEYKHEN